MLTKALVFALYITVRHSCDARYMYVATYECRSQNDAHIHVSINDKLRDLRPDLFARSNVTSPQLFISQGLEFWSDSDKYAVYAAWIYSE